MQPAGPTDLIVEVSSWDNEGWFFVERATSSAWGPSERRYCCVILCRAARFCPYVPLTRIAGQNPIPKSAILREWSARRAVDTASYIWLIFHRVVSALVSQRTRQSIL